MKKLDLDRLSRNKGAIGVLHTSYIKWNWASANAAAVDILKKNKHRVNNAYVLMNHSIVDCDYSKIKKERYAINQDIRSFKSST